MGNEQVKVTTLGWRTACFIVVVIVLNLLHCLTNVAKIAGLVLLENAFKLKNIMRYLWLEAVEDMFPMLVDEAKFDLNSVVKH